MKSLLTVFSFAILYTAPSAFAVTIGQTDTFQIGLDNWQGGAGGFTVASTGGPAGVGDQYLQLNSGGSPLPPRMSAFNDSQWLGDFTAAGVTAVAVDLLNSGTTSLSMRVAIREAAGGSTTAGYASSNPFILPPDNLWHHAIFDLNAASLTGFNSPQPLSVDLANVKDFRILDSAAPSGVGDIVTAQVGIDNVTALPEPTSATLSVAAASIAIWSALGGLRRDRALSSR